MDYRGLVVFICVLSLTLANKCSKEDFDCSEGDTAEEVRLRYSRDWTRILKKIEAASASYIPCSSENCTCHESVIKTDLAPFSKGITLKMLDSVQDRGSRYQVINHRLFREEACMFPARCSGVEHFILKILNDLPDMEFILNTRDWPQVSRHHNQPLPVFSFSKTASYYDIMYPAWSFWEGGPAISLYPQGLGRWDTHIQVLSQESKQWPWEKKIRKGFFRGSRTSDERDSLILLSREHPTLLDAAYTKNQAWKSDADTLHAPPAKEVRLEDHCKYRYLFNFRGVAASFRLKHLFLCNSLVFHVGNEWMEFFYAAMKPWVHYIPVKSKASKEEIEELLLFAKENDAFAKKIAQQGFDFITNHLRMEDVSCYWKNLLKSYSRLLKFKPERNTKFIEIKKKGRKQ